MLRRGSEVSSRSVCQHLGACRVVVSGMKGARLPAPCAPLPLCYLSLTLRGTKPSLAESTSKMPLILASVSASTWRRQGWVSWVGWQLPPIARAQLQSGTISTHRYASQLPRPGCFS